MVNRKEVARLAGVSTATVTRVASGKGCVSAETREKVLKIINELHYKPNSVACNLKLKKNKAIAVLVEDLCNPYIAEAVEVMTTEAMRYGYVIMLFFVSTQNINEVIDDVLENNVSGLINLALLNVNIEKECGQKFCGRDIRMINVLSNQGLSIKMNYEKAMKQAFSLLKERGKKHAVFVGGMLRSWMFGDNRVKSFLSAGREAGFPSEEKDVFSGDYPKEKYTDIGYRVVKTLLSAGKRFDAVFCMTDSIAIGALKALTDSGKNVPRDVAVIGCDNVNIAGMLTPALTTFDGRIEELAKEYVRYIIDPSAENYREFECELIIRNTL